MVWASGKDCAPYRVRSGYSSRRLQERKIDLSGLRCRESEHSISIHLQVGGADRPCNPIVASTCKERRISLRDDRIRCDNANRR